MRAKFGADMEEQRRARLAKRNENDRGRWRTKFGADMEE